MTKSSPNSRDGLASQPSHTHEEIWEEIKKRIRDRESCLLDADFAIRRRGETRTPPLHILPKYALLLYITLSLICSRSPFQTPPMKYRDWAAILGHSDPSNAGQQQVSKAFKTLVENKLVKEIDPAELNQFSTHHTSLYGFHTFQILNVKGTGEAYVPPRRRYGKIPTEMWTSQKLQRMSTAALRLYICLALDRAYLQPVYFINNKYVHTRYGTNNSSFNKGLAELSSEELHILQISTTKEDIDRKFKFYNETQEFSTYKLHETASPKFKYNEIQLSENIKPKLIKD